MLYKINEFCLEDYIWGRWCSFRMIQIALTFQGKRIFPSGGWMIKGPAIQSTELQALYL